MRHEAANFQLRDLKKIMKLLHHQKKKGYLTLNTFFKDHEFNHARKILMAAKKAEVDAVILWDMGILSMAKEAGLRIHLSTQANVTNSESICFFVRQKVRRIVLARECTLNDIKGVSQKLKRMKIPCEIEVFVHGAMCVSISGRCFLSSYSFAKSANRGQCFQPCRREYSIQCSDKELKYDLGKDYVLSPKDLCTIDFLDSILTTGVSALKIEGRIRSAEYVRIVTECYRQALDACLQKRFDNIMRRELKNKLKDVYNRGFSSGFYFGIPDDDLSRSLENRYAKQYLGEVANYFKKISVAEIKIRNKGLKKGETILFIGKETPAHMFEVNEIERDHRKISRAQKGQSIGLKVPFAVRRKDQVYLWKKRF